MLGFLGGSPGLVAHLARKSSADYSFSKESTRLYCKVSMWGGAGYEVSKRGSDPMKDLDLLAIWPSA